MPQRNFSRRLLRRSWDEWDERRFEDAQHLTPAATRPRRAVQSFVLAALFFAGAALSAGAGDQMHTFLGDGGGQSPAAAQPASASTDSTPGDTTSTDSTTTATAPEPAAPEPAPAPTPATPAPADATPPAAAAPSHESADAPTGPTENAPRAGQVPHSSSNALTPAPASTPDASAAEKSLTRATRIKHMPPAARRKVAPKRVVRKPVRQAPEIEGPAAGATVWLNRAMPDPTPPEARLSQYFADHLVPSSQKQHLDWALVLGVLRADGGLGPRPTSLGGLESTELRLAKLGAGTSAWRAARAYLGTSAAADRAVALMHLYRAIGMDAVVQGLEAQRYALGHKLLSDKRVSIYPGGIGDVASGRVNVRVVAMIEYLADTFGQVSVSCLITGHRLYARPGVVSAHIYGLAADISVLADTPIVGHQQPGSITQRAVKALLLLPAGMLPKQVISLIGMGGPSFALADHYNHIHVGY
jgi:hypothetical protein